ncbi:hypothetical protein [Promicromonospora sp. NPDC057488]|uniref:hypothetical protein n=1 Tax=Promicromonospora sp. NPDC057488 TaxID=3346147 RepID=UPI0036710991
MGITVIAVLFAAIAFCLCKFGPERWGPSIFMMVTGLLLASTRWGQQAQAFVVDLVNNLFGGIA